MGTHTLKAQYLGDVDYQPSTTGSVTVNVIPAVLTVTAQSVSRTYGAADPSFTYSITGFENGDFLDQSKLAAAPAYAASDSGPASPVGNYTIALSQGNLSYNDPNYVFATGYFVAGELTIAPALLTITAENLTLTYGPGTTFAGTEFTTSGLTNSDTVSSVTLISVGAAAGASVAGSPYPIVPSAAVGKGLSNYTIDYVNGVLSVTSAILTITASPQTKAYGATDPPLTYSSSGFQSSDTASTLLKGTLSRSTGEHVSGGPYAITQGTLAANSNYTIQFTGSYLTITPAPLMIQAASASKVYGTALPTLTASYTGLVNGDTAASITTPPTLTCSASAASTVSGGPYPITAGGA